MWVELFAAVFWFRLNWVFLRGDIQKSGRCVWAQQRYWQKASQRTALEQEFNRANQMDSGGEDLQQLEFKVAASSTTDQAVENIKNSHWGRRIEQAWWLRVHLDVAWAFSASPWRNPWVSIESVLAFMARTRMTLLIAQVEQSTAWLWNFGTRRSALKKATPSNGRCAFKANGLRDELDKIDAGVVLTSWLETPCRTYDPMRKRQWQETK